MLIMYKSIIDNIDENLDQYDWHSKGIFSRCLQCYMLDD